VSTCAWQQKELPVQRPRIFLADDHADFLAVVIRLIESEFDVIQTFQDGQAIVDAADTWDFDLVLMDISMPGLNGTEAARQLKAAGCKAKVVFLTVHQDQDYVRSALATGALGYVVKDRMASDLLPALHEALADHHYISRCVSQEQS
jgi:DNA-binding NarL/FixJ family response regulator